MPLFDAVPGGALPAATYNLNVRNQVITTCTSSTRPATPVEGQFIYETNNDAMAFWNGSAWIYAPPVLLYQASATQAFTASQTSTNITFDVEVIDLGAIGAVGSATLTVPLDGLYSLSLDCLRSAGTGTLRIAATSANLGLLPLLTGTSLNAFMSVDSATRRASSFVSQLAAGDVITITGSENAAAVATLDLVVRFHRIA